MFRLRKLTLLIAFTASLFLTATRTPAQTAPATNPTACLTNVDAATDYFPDKAKVQYAEGLEIEYFKTYKVARLKTPWSQAKQGFEYVLTQCGAPVPKVGDPGVGAKAQFFTVPIQSIVAMSTTYLPALDILGVVGTLKGMDTTAYAYAPSVVERIKNKAVIEVGSGSTVNVEALLILKPDLVMTYGSGSAEFDTQPKLIEAKIPVALNAEFMETSPLGRAEWIKYIALFYNAEGKANSAFTATTDKYTRLAKLSGAAKTRPTVLINAPYKGTWYLSGGKSFQARFLADAGADYLWADDKTSGVITFDFEAVFAKAKDADFWLNAGFPDRQEALKSDSRYAEFAAFKSGNVWNNDKRLNANFGNDYFESGVANPDLVLSDLIAILHPELLPNATLTYYQQMGK